MRPSSQQSTPSIGSRRFSSTAASAIAGPSMVLGSTVEPTRYSCSQLGCAVWNRCTLYRLLIERSRYSR